MNIFQIKQRRLLFSTIAFVGIFLVKSIKNLSVADGIHLVVTLPLIAGICGSIIFLIFICLHHFLSKSKPKLSFTLDSIFLCFVFFLVLNLNLSFSLHDNEINSKLRSQIDAQDQKIIKSFIDNNPKVMFEMFSDEAKKVGITSIENVYTQLKGKITSEQSSNYDQYLINTDSGPNVTILSENDEKFQLSVPRKSNKTFVSLKRITGRYVDLLLSNVYIEENGEWKLFISNLGEVAIGGKTSYQWIEESKKYYDAKSYVMSLMALDVASKITPAPFIEYKNKKIIEELAAKNMNEMKNIKWPIVVDFIQTRPHLISIKSQVLDGVLYPRIYYVTQVPFTNPKKLQEEAERMKEYVISIFDGVAKDRSHLLFLAYNEMPNDSKKTYKTYGVVVDLKK